NPLAFARYLALEQRDQNSHCAKDPGTEIRNGNPDPNRSLAGEAGNGHQTAHALGDLVKARPLSVGAVFSEAGDRAVDDALVDRADGLIVDPEAKFDVGTVVLDDDIGRFYHPFENCDSFLFLQVERKAAFVAMEVLEVGSVPWATHVAFAEPLGKLDL